MSKAIKEGLLPKLRERHARRGRAGKTPMLDELRKKSGWRALSASILFAGPSGGQGLLF